MRISHFQVHLVVQGFNDGLMRLQSPIHADQRGLA